MKIKKVLLTIMGVSCIGLLGMSAVGCSNAKNDPSTLKGAYFNITETYENNDVVNSNELIKNLSEAKFTRTKGSVETESYENDGSQIEYATSKYEFKKGNEVLGVEYIGDDTTRESGLESLESTYYRILKDDSENMYLNMYYSESIHGKVSMEMYLDSVEEQREATNLIYDNKKISNMYEVYYKLAQSIEDDSKISISDIEELLENKKLKKSGDFYSENTNLKYYSYSQDGLMMDIVYDEKENKCYEIILEDIEAKGVSLYCYKDMSYGVRLIKRNTDYKEQQDIVNKLMDKIELSDEK